MSNLLTNKRVMIIEQKLKKIESHCEEELSANTHADHPSRTYDYQHGRNDFASEVYSILNYRLRKKNLTF